MAENGPVRNAADVLIEAVKNESTRTVYESREKSRREKLPLRMKYD